MLMRDLGFGEHHPSKAKKLGAMTEKQYYKIGTVFENLPLVNILWEVKMQLMFKCKNAANVQVMAQRYCQVT